MEITVAGDNRVTIVIGPNHASNWQYAAHRYRFSIEKNFPGFMRISRTPNLYVLFVDFPSTLITHSSLKKIIRVINDEPESKYWRLQVINSVHAS